MEKNPANPTMLVILDGFGYSKNQKGNAIAHANMPNWNNWLKKYPNRLLKASGEAVGLLPNYMGNSEVGHFTMGSGRITQNPLVKFHKIIEDESFFENEILIKSFEKLKEKNKSLHLMGLLSDSGVHSHTKHLFAFLKLAKQIGLKQVYIHAFLDGRDTPPKSAATYLKQLEEECKKLEIGEIASIHGRYFAMDRDNNWERIQESYKILTTPPTEQFVTKTWQEVLENSYKKNETDEFVSPTLLIKDGILQPEDGMVFYNFRPDRARQLSECFLSPDFNRFKRENFIPLTFFISTTRYKDEFTAFDNIVLFENKEIKNTFFDVLEQNKKTFFIIAETEKYAHVTYFFRGMVDKKFKYETRVLIPSIKAKNYIENPQMSAQKITDKVLNSLQTNPNNFYLINYANPDMVGHSANFKATVKACEFLDKQLKQLYDEIVEKQNGTIFITADHGNAEEMLDENGNPKSSHTCNPVPFIIISKQNNQSLKLSVNPNLGISNIAPTILKFMNLNIPKEMNKKTIF